MIYEGSLEYVKDISAGEYVYRGVGSEVRLLLRCIYAACSPPHPLPRAGGYLDQPPKFLECLQLFQNAERVYMEQKQINEATLKSLGMK